MRYCLVGLQCASHFGRRQCSSKKSRKSKSTLMYIVNILNILAWSLLLSSKFGKKKMVKNTDHENVSVLVLR